MAEYVVMPKLGFDMREGVLNTWLKQVGEEVSQGEVIAEIESDKATLELESQVSGVLLQQLAQTGEVVPVGANLAIVGAAGEDVSEMAKVGAASADKAVIAPVQPTTVAPVEATPALERPVVAASDFPGSVKASPVARRLAREMGIDLRQVNGTGPAGRVRKADVEAFRLAPAQPTPVRAATIPAGPDTTEVPTSRLRQAIGRRMAESKMTVPHFYVTNEIDMDAALALRKQINALLPEEQKVTVNDLVVKAAALALRLFPNINASYAGETVVRHNHINIGSAVAVEGGLLTVVQKDTDVTPLAQIAADNRKMVARARSGKMHPDDVTGGTFTVSNLGAYDVDHFIAIINPPDAAILAVGSARQVPVVKEGQLTVGNRMKATISADHRVTDGAEAAHYMQELKAILEEPLRLLM